MNTQEKFYVNNICLGFALFMLVILNITKHHRRAYNSKENNKEEFSTFHFYFLNYTICLTFKSIPHQLNTHKKSSNGTASTVRVN